MLILGDLYTVEYAQDGEEAVERLRREPFDLLILDLKMPKLDGFEVMKRLKAESIRIPIIVLTAYQSVGVAINATDLGIVEYLPKPFERDHVLRVVAGALANSRQKQPPTS